MEAKMIETTLTDNSIVYDVILYQDGERIVIDCADKISATQVADFLNLFISKHKILGFSS